MTSRRSIHVVALPYRDYWFQQRYGTSVRDLCMIAALQPVASVSATTAICRPRVIWDGMEFFRSQRDIEENETNWIRSRSFDCVGSLAGRRWTRHAMAGVVEQAVSDALRHSGHVFLFDAHPIAMFDPALASDSRVHYHFDVIDNFHKHVRFSARDRARVAEKHAFVRTYANSVSAVSSAAAIALGRTDAQVLPSGVSINDFAVVPVDRAEFDFGLLGFIDEKTDVDLVRMLSASGYAVLVAGAIYDRTVAAELARIPGVQLSGPFNSRDVPRICARFRFGLVAYRASKLHDGSPTKLFRYLACGRAVVSNLRTGLESEAILYLANDGTDASVSGFVEKWNSRFVEHGIHAIEGIARELPADYVWENRMQGLLP